MEKSALNQELCFNIYYLNFSKVYEISMMINNVLISSIQKEHSKVSERFRSLTASLSGNTGINSKKYLTDIKSVISSESNERSTHSSKMIESLDVKTTKSILLRKIVEKCTTPKEFGNLREGDLVKIDNIQLKILNEENLRQILMLRKDALKGLQVEGMEVNNLISSILQDYSYILYGEFETGEEIVIKIPLEIENEFESKYNVDDLLLGHVSVIGVYKGSVTEKFINSNTFNYLSSLGNQQNQPEKKVFPSSNINTDTNLTAFNNNKSYRFIDVIAIIQDVSFKQVLPKVKMKWYKELFYRFKGGHISE